MCMCTRGALRACLDECGFGNPDGFHANEHHDQRRRSCCFGAAVAYGSMFVCMWVATTFALAVGLCVYILAVYGPTALLLMQS